jgi:dihydroorotate dehydrogenase electron transfer subunit
MKKLCPDITVCTDDGTLGKRGLVTRIFQNDMKNFAPDDTSIYACGPKKMLKALAGILQKSPISCQVSLEERMACGTGACMGCAVAIKDKKGVLAYKRVCADGPVFNLADIVW